VHRQGQRTLRVRRQGLYDGHTLAVVIEDTERLTGYARLGLQPLTGAFSRSWLRTVQPLV
jgi:hypothetical protein